MPITVLGRIRKVETIATGRGIRDRVRLIRAYGSGQWRKRKGIARVMLESGLVVTAEIHWLRGHWNRTQGHEGQAHTDRLMMRRKHSCSYVVCVSNRGYRASLVIRKIYRTLPDSRAQALGLMRVVDESGEDYLYPERLFVAIEVPRGAARAFRAAS